MLTFLLQASTGASRLYIATAWGKKLSAFFGGYENALLIHQWAGVAMIAVFVVHTLSLLVRIDWRNLGESLFGQDSLIPNLQDAKNLWHQILWLFGMSRPPRLTRWTYWEKFDYWAVYWGLPLLAVTGLMLMYPLVTSRYLPGWSLNIAALLHRAEAILAVAYIFIVHFFVGHLRPSSFPMNEAMFSGSVPFEEAISEKPGWVERLKSEGKLDETVAAPAPWYRTVYFVFGYTALIFGVYLLLNGIIYGRYITLH
jgi:cytochrome b subunit of formate dehydrogenase